MMPLRKTLRAVAIAAVLGTSSSSAVAAEVSVDVPFDFVVKDKALPAGRYHVSITHGLVMFQARGNAALVFAKAVASSQDAKARLVFRKLEGEYVLLQAWVDGVRHELAASRVQHGRMTAGPRDAAAQDGEWVTVPAL